MSLEKDLVQDCKDAAERMGAMLAVVGQRRAKGSGTTVGYPDLTLICSGEVVLIEVKRTKDAENGAGTLNMGQIAFIEKAAEQDVGVRVVASLQDFIDCVNWCRRPRGVQR